MKNSPTKKMLIVSDQIDFINYMIHRMQDRCEAHSYYVDELKTLSPFQFSQYEGVLIDTKAWEKALLILSACPFGITFDRLISVSLEIGVNAPQHST